MLNYKKCITVLFMLSIVGIDNDHLSIYLFICFRFMNIEIVNELKKPSFSALKRQNPFIHLLDESKKLREQTTQVRFFYEFD